MVPKSVVLSLHSRDLLGMEESVCDPAAYLFFVWTVLLLLNVDAHGDVRYRKGKNVIAVADGKMHVKHIGKIGLSALETSDLECVLRVESQKETAQMIFRKLDDLLVGRLQRIVFGQININHIAPPFHHIIPHFRRLFKHLHKNTDGCRSIRPMCQRKAILVLALELVLVLLYHLLHRDTRTTRKLRVPIGASRRGSFS